MQVYARDAIVRLQPLGARNDIFAWPAAHAVCGLNGLTLKATPGQAVELVRAAERGELDEIAIAVRLTEFSGGHPNG